MSSILPRMSSRPSGAVPTAGIPRALSEFLVELAVALHKNAIYPPGHPMLEGATGGIAATLATLLDERPSLSIGVAREQIIIEGIATEEGNPMLRDLAQRLHRHQLGAIRFARGVTGEEVAGALALIALDAGRRAQPLGLEGPAILEQWPHVRLLPMTFGELQLLNEEAKAGSDEGDAAEMRTDSRGAQLWIGLARASLAAASGARSEADAESEAVRLDSTESTDPRNVAKAIDAHGSDAAYDQVVVGYLLQIAEQIKSKGDRESAALQKRLSNLVSTLQPATLERLLEMGGDGAQRRRFVGDAVQGMAADAVIELVRSAASTSGQTISSSLVRMLTKLAAHAGEGTASIRPQADTALRDQVQQLIQDWELDDPNPDGYRGALEKMSRGGSSEDVRRPPDGLPCEPERLLQMGIEIGTLGAPVWRALDVLASREDLGATLDLLNASPEGAVRDALHSHVMVVDRLRQQLDHLPVNLDVVQRMVSHMQLAAAEPLLDALDTADDRHALAYMDLLAKLGRDVGPFVLARLQGARWVLQRRLLAVLGNEQVVAEAFNPAVYRAHPDPAVRREALRLMLRRPETHARAVTSALADRDERNVRLAIGAVMSSCTQEAAAILMARSTDDGISADVRAMGIRAIASCPAPETVRFLAGRAVGRTAILRRRVLAAKSPEMLAALSGLATHWRDHADAALALRLAATSEDAEVRDAVTRRVNSP